MLGASGSLGGPLLVALFALVLIGISLYAVIEAVKRPSARWKAVGESKTGWLVAIVISSFVQPIGVITASIFLVRTRGRLDSGGASEVPSLDRRLKL